MRLRFSIKLAKMHFEEKFDLAPEIIFFTSVSINIVYFWCSSTAAVVSCEYYLVNGIFRSLHWCWWSHIIMVYQVYLMCTAHVIYSLLPWNVVSCHKIPHCGQNQARCRAALGFDCPFTAPAFTTVPSLLLSNCCTALYTRLPAFYFEMRKVSCEYDRLNGWNSTSKCKLRGTYMRHVRWAYDACIRLMYIYVVNGWF